MVINTHYKFVFVHVPKVAGTSIMKCLQAAQGNDNRWLGDTKHETLAELHANLTRRRSRRDKLFLRTPINYFSFAFVRNPWDRMASFYRFLIERRPRQEIDRVSSFKDFLAQARDGVSWIQNLYSMKSQLDFFTFSDGHMKLGFLGHFEFLEEDINSIATRIGCPITLAHLKRSSNTGNDYRNDYDEESIEIVASRFSEEIAHFGYTFDERRPTRRCSEQLDRRR